MDMYVYIRSEPWVWMVGFYRPDGIFEPDSDQGGREETAKRVAWLNGGPGGSQEMVMAVDN